MSDIGQVVGYSGRFLQNHACRPDRFGLIAAPMWCIVVQSIRTRNLAMKRPTSRPKALPPSTRASVSFPRPIYDELEKIAEAKKVSLAWVVREAAEKYVADQWPLLAESSGSVTP